MITPTWDPCVTVEWLVVEQGPFVNVVASFHQYNKLSPPEYYTSIWLAMSAYAHYFSSHSVFSGKN
jgi:hypothetical protein